MENTGIERDPIVQKGAGQQRDTQCHSYKDQHLRLTQVILKDRTDHHNELVQTRDWVLHPFERELEIRGNCFVVENLLSGNGDVWILQAPLPEARQETLGNSTPDLQVCPNGSSGYDFYFTPCESGALRFDWVRIPFSEGTAGRIKALHAWQRKQGKGASCPRLLSNTWGDRSRDGRISEAFLKQEIPKAAKLGIEVLQLDSGWQKGTDANSVNAQSEGGVWSGFWEADPDFWTPHPDRFPNGLEPSIGLMRDNGIQPGLWYAPDSSENFINWERDAMCILDLHRKYGVDHFKLDSINAQTELAWQRLSSMFTRIRQESEGRIVIDLDITAGNRPGYWYKEEAGVLFLENRYTDWRSYWPQLTLRNLWQLSHWIDPRRLRIEFLNPLRNPDKYGDSPLAPACHDFQTLFAITMAANPLAWFENSGLTDAQILGLAPLVELWKQERQAMLACDIIPVGADPDGTACAGFLFIEADAPAYALLFRQLTDQTDWHFDLTCMGLPRISGKAHALRGDGNLELAEGQLSVSISEPLKFGFFRFDR